MLDGKVDGIEVDGMAFVDIQSLIDGIVAKTRVEALYIRIVQSERRWRR
jgi:hypothetical protein